MSRDGRPLGSELLRGAAIIAALGATSIGFGFAKDVLVAAVYGVQSSTDAYFAALAGQRLFASLTLALLAAVAVTVFVDVRERRGSGAAWRYAESLLGLAVISSIGIAAIAAVFAPPIIAILATGFEADVANQAATTLVLLAPTAGLAGLALVLGALLNANRVFALPAALGIVVNTAVVVFILSSPAATAPGALALGTDVGYGIFVLAELAVAIRLGLRLRITHGLSDRDVHRTLLLALPLAGGAVAEQLGAASERVFASFGDVGTLSTYIFANKVRNVPGALIGSAIGTVLYPALASRVALGDLEGFRILALRAARYVVLASTPVALTLVVLATPITKAVYERGAFSAGDTSSTAAVLAVLGAGVVAKSLVEVLARVFYARQNTRFPAFAAVVALGAQVLVAALLVPQWGPVGVGVAVSIASTLQATYLAIPLRSSLGFGRGFVTEFLRLAIATAAYVAVALGGWNLVEKMLRPETTPVLIVALIGLVVAASVAYFGVLVALRQPDVNDAVDVLRHHFYSRSSVQIDRSANARG